MSYQENEFLNKKIIVTGASSGIGQSIALYFLNCGAHVILAGQDTDTMELLCKKHNFPNATIMKVDLANDVHIYDFKTSVVERFGKPDILINCAGVKLDGDVEKTFPQDFDYSLDLNLRAVFVTIKNLAGFLNPNASIINISCFYGTRPFYGVLGNCTSKAGLEALTRYSAAEFAALGIRVNAVSACAVDTNSLRLVGVTESENERFKKRMEKFVPLGRIARPDDVVKAVVFLASERSKKITGQVIKVDGGRSLTSSGYVHYRGMKNMNTRFEPDEVNFSTLVEDVKGFFSGITKSNVPPNDPDKLRKFVEEKVAESNFSTRLADAHQNIKANYKLVDTNDNILKDKFLEGRTPNPLYDIKEQEQIKRTTLGRVSDRFDANYSYNMKQAQMDDNNYNVGNEGYQINNGPMDENMEGGNVDSYNRGSNQGYQEYQ